jgi:hypothetical protein
VHPPSDWGVQAVVRRRLEPLLADLELRTRTVPLSFPDADAFFSALLRPLEVDGAALRPQLERLLASCNDTVGGPVEVPGRYLLALGRRA